MWIVEQRDPSGRWFTRATLFEQQDAVDRARLFKAHNLKLRFRYVALTRRVSASMTARR